MTLCSCRPTSDKGGHLQPEESSWRFIYLFIYFSIRSFDLFVFLIFITPYTNNHQHISTYFHTFTTLAVVIVIITISAFDVRGDSQPRGTKTAKTHNKYSRTDNILKQEVTSDPAIAALVLKKMHPNFLKNVTVRTIQHCRRTSTCLLHVVPRNACSLRPWRRNDLIYAPNI